MQNQGRFTREKVSEPSEDVLNAFVSDHTCEQSTADDNSLYDNQASTSCQHPLPPGDNFDISKPATLSSVVITGQSHPASQVDNCNNRKRPEYNELDKEEQSFKHLNTNRPDCNVDDNLLFDADDIGLNSSLADDNAFGDDELDITLLNDNDEDVEDKCDLNLLKGDDDNDEYLDLTLLDESDCDRELDLTLLDEDDDSDNETLVDDDEDGDDCDGDLDLTLLDETDDSDNETLVDDDEDGDDGLDLTLVEDDEEEGDGNIDVSLLDDDEEVGAKLDSFVDNDGKGGDEVDYSMLYDDDDGTNELVLSNVDGDEEKSFYSSTPRQCIKHDRSPEAVESGWKIEEPTDCFAQDRNPKSVVPDRKEFKATEVLKQNRRPDAESETKKVETVRKKVKLIEDLRRDESPESIESCLIVKRDCIPEAESERKNVCVKDNPIPEEVDSDRTELKPTFCLNLDSISASESETKKVNSTKCSEQDCSTESVESDRKNTKPVECLKQDRIPETLESETKHVKLIERLKRDCSHETVERESETKHVKLIERLKRDCSHETVERDRTNVKPVEGFKKAHSLEAVESETKKVKPTESMKRGCSPEAVEQNRECLDMGRSLKSVETDRKNMTSVDCLRQNRSPEVIESERKKVEPTECQKLDRSPEAIQSERKKANPTECLKRDRSPEAVETVRKKVKPTECLKRSHSPEAAESVGKKVKQIECLKRKRRRKAVKKARMKLKYFLPVSDQKAINYNVQMVAINSEIHKHTENRSYSLVSDDGSSNSEANKLRFIGSATDSNSRGCNELDKGCSNETECLDNEIFSVASNDSISDAITHKETTTVAADIIDCLTYSNSNDHNLHDKARNSEANENIKNKSYLYPIKAGTSYRVRKRGTFSPYPYAFLINMSSDSSIDLDNSDEGVDTHSTCPCKGGRPISIKWITRVPEMNLSTPLYRKLLEYRLMRNSNRQQYTCCERDCSRRWHHSSEHNVMSDYVDTDLHVDYFSWGTWKQEYTPTCFCTTRRSFEVQETERRFGFRVVVPLYNKVLYTRLMRQSNRKRYNFCGKFCDYRHRKNVYRNMILEDYSNSDVRVSLYSWGVWKDKTEPIGNGKRIERLREGEKRKMEKGKKRKRGEMEGKEKGHREEEEKGEMEWIMNKKKRIEN